LPAGGGLTNGDVVSLEDGQAVGAWAVGRARGDHGREVTDGTGERDLAHAGGI
jgi:hypothetical protein